MKKLIILIVAILLLVPTSSALAVWRHHSNAAGSAYGWVTTAPSAINNHNFTIGITLAGDNKETTFTSSVPFDMYNAKSDTYESEAIRGVMSTLNTFVEVILNNQNQVIGFQRIHRPNVSLPGGTDGSHSYYLDSMKYGGELTAPGGGPGNMVALGWVLGKNELSNGARTITLGDGNNVVKTFNETYTLAPNCQIYIVNNPGASGALGEANVPISGDWTSVQGSFNDVQLTPLNSSGEIYGIRERRTAMCIFDESAVDPTTGKTRADVSTARVKELYIFKNTTRVPANSDVAAPDDVGYNGTSWLPGVDKRAPNNMGITGTGWNGIGTPFEILSDRLYSIGDCYTGVFLFVSDADALGKKTLTVLDMGNADASYAYWLNIEKMGYDPRDIDNILLTHGHGDHYAALWECVTMINRAAGKDKADVYTCIANEKGFIYGVYTGVSLSAAPERYTIDYFNDSHKWVPFGKGVTVYPIPTPGHSNDTTSFIYKLTTQPYDQFFKKQVETAWVYMGGYGGASSTQVSRGYTKLQYKNSMQYLQSVIVPYAESVADYVYNIPQHGDQAPWYEVSKVIRMMQSSGSNIHFLDVWNEGREGIINLFEKRLSAYTFQWMNSAWKATQADATANPTNFTPVDLYDQTIVPFIRNAGYNWYCTPQTANTESGERFGPWKRDAGMYKITVGQEEQFKELDSVLVLHGFDALQNKNSLLKNITNIYGWDISNGVPVDRDSYSHDPNGWYVQLVVNVDDDYVGGLYFTEQDAIDIAKSDGRNEPYPVNWYVAQGNAYVNFNGGTVAPASGPIEMVTGPNWKEIIRTQRLNTKEEAEEIASHIRRHLKKGRNTFEVKLNRSGEIVLPDGYVSAANAPLDDEFLTSLNDSTIKRTFVGAGFYSLAEEPNVIKKSNELNKKIDLTTMFVSTNPLDDELTRFGCDTGFAHCFLTLAIFASTFVIRRRK